MSREDEQLALEVAIPEIFKEWQRRAGTSRAWQEYFLLLNTFAEALRRAPCTPDACEKIDPAEYINMELACLSDVLLFLFPDGVMAQKSYKAVRQDGNETTHADAIDA